MCRRPDRVPGGDRGDLPADDRPNLRVHLIRASLKYVPRREREQVARDLKPIYTAINADAAQAELERLDEKWGQRFPVITQDAARKLVYLALQNAVPQWTRTRNWTTALLAFKIHFGDRVPDTAN